MRLYDYQIDAVKHMKNGCILNGGVGSGKSLTSLAYYYIQQGGSWDFNRRMYKPKDLYIITTARKRDTFEWDEELAKLGLSQHKDISLYNNNVVIDSWNNISKYDKVYDSFFIFDEQRVVGSGAWVKAFLKITNKNKWILLSATPGDTWSDYIPVFVANGFYKNKTDFQTQHVVWSRFTKYPKIDKYVNVKKLVKLRNDILIEMNFDRKTVHHDEELCMDYDIFKYKTAFKTRWNEDLDKPFETANELCLYLRQIINTDESRKNALLDILKKHNRVIVFYNFNYELDILKNLPYAPGTKVAEWNGHNHQPIPKTKKWVYLVQYTAGCEGWNCISTDTIVFYSQNYSYKVTQQAKGRIDRLNTPYEHLYYYSFLSKAPIDIAIKRALNNKKNFNEKKFLNWT